MDTGADHRAVAVTAPPAVPLVATPMIGAEGTVAGTTLVDSVENAPVPIALTART